MAEKEISILAALQTVSEFTAVRYITREMGDELKPESLPFAVYEMGERDYTGYQTFCGVDPDSFDQGFDVQIFAKDADEVRRLARKSIAALSGIGVVGGLDDQYEPDLRCFTTTVSFF